MTDFIEYNLGTIAAQMPDRRERIATACLAALLTREMLDGSYQITAQKAVMCAKALIAELDKEVQP